MSRWRYEDGADERRDERLEKRAARRAQVTERRALSGAPVDGDASRPGREQFPPNVRAWLAGPLDEEAVRQVRAIAGAEDVVRVAVMPDAHAGELLGNGCVVATTGLVYPRAVGGDIGCGFTAAPLGVEAALLRPESRALEVLRALRAQVPIIRHRRSASDEFLSSVEVVPKSGASGGGGPHQSLGIEGLSAPALRTLASRNGVVEFGTLGRGNHFVELARDDGGELWVLVHSGSRAMGPAILAHHLRGDQRHGVAGLGADTERGAAYLADAAWATRYASASRLAMARSVAAVVPSSGAAVDSSRLVDAPHNTITREAIDGRTLLVHRKGANAAGLGASVVVAGSAGTFSVIGAGRGAAEALNSCSHGAGRRWSRSEAALRVTAADVRAQLRGVVFDGRLAGRLTTEAPGAYRDLREVMSAQRDMVKEVVRLTPVLSFKGVQERARAREGGCRA